MEKTIKKDGIIYQKTRIPKHQHECDSCDYGHKYGRKEGCDNYTIDGCKANFHYKIKENNMKKSELSFKVLTMDRKRTDKIIAALEKAGIECEKGAIEAMAFEIKSGNLEYWTSPFDGDCEKFDDSPMQEVSLKDALKLIESIESYAPEFDIKLREEVLVSDVDSDIWELCDFARVHTDCFMMVGYGYGQKLIKYKGNEKYHGTTDMPPGWWECENGKPVWRTK